MKDNYTDVLLEDINSKFDAVLEAVGQLSDDLKKTAKQSALEAVRDDIKVVKAVITDTNHQTSDHESRLSRLETNHI